ncbi:unnamed protein product, partial [Effrenium voratum]
MNEAALLSDRLGPRIERAGRKFFHSARGGEGGIRSLAAPQDFGSLSFEKGKPEAVVWRWVTWESSMDMLHERHNSLLDRRKQQAEQLVRTAENGRCCMSEMKQAVGRLKASSQAEGLSDLEQWVARMDEEVLRPLQAFAETHSGAGELLATERLPPTMVSSLADNKLVSDDFLAEVSRQKSLTSRVLRRTVSLMSRTSTFETVDGGPSASAGEEKSAWNVSMEMDSEKDAQGVILVPAMELWGDSPSAASNSWLCSCTS